MRCLMLTAFALGISIGPVASAQLPAGADTQAAPRPDPSVKRPPTAPAFGIGLAPAPVPRLRFIGNQAVQKELDLKPEQNAKMAGILDRLRTEGDANRKRFTPSGSQLPSEPLDPDEIRNQSQAMMVAREELDATAEEAIKKTLNPKQRIRFEEIRLQAEGPFAFLDPETHQMLNLDPGQLETIEAILTEGRNMVISAMRSPVGSRAGAGQPTTKKRVPSVAKQGEDVLKQRQEAVRNARNKTMSEISRVLTKGQRTKYRKMLGEPYDLQKLNSLPFTTP